MQVDVMSIKKIQCKIGVDEIAVEAYNTRVDNAALVGSPLIWCGFIFAFGFVCFLLIVRAHMECDILSTFACFLVMGTTTFGFIFLFVHFRYGKKLFKLTSKGLRITWSALLPYKSYLIHFEDILDFRIDILNSRLSFGSAEFNGCSHVLVVDTSEMEFQMIASLNFDLLDDIEKKLNKTLEMLKNKDNSCYPSDYILLQKSKNEDIGNSCDQIYKYSRCGNFDFYFFLVVLLPNCWIIGVALMHAMDFFTLSWKPAIIVFPLCTFVGVAMSLFLIFMLFSPFYYEYWFFEDRRIIRRCSLFMLKKIKEILVGTVRAVVLERGCPPSSVFFGDHIVPLRNEVLTWQLKILDHDDRTIITVKSLDRREAERLAFDLKNFYGCDSTIAPFKGTKHVIVI
jgi:hypothetical protein